MKDMSEEALERLAEHWRRNDEPPEPHLYDAIIILTESTDTSSTFEVYGAVRWDPVRQRYEVEPVVEHCPGLYVQAELQLSPERFAEAQQILAEMGITHLVRIYDRTQPPAKQTTTLPASLFPIAIER